jgi:uncharacterized protein (DUF305 family)
MFTNRSMRGRLTLAAVAGAGALMLLTACGGNNDSGSMAGHDGMTSAPATAGNAAATQPTASFNDADVMFAQMMIPHHRQAVEMAGLAQSRASAPEVKQLAVKIKGAQDPEITTMTGWLSAWGKPATPDAGMSGHDMSGMMNDQDMTKLQTAKGADFDRMFLQMMTAHHNGAIKMARTEQAQGASPEAKQLAKTIETAQQAEVAQMQKMLDQL